MSAQIDTIALLAASGDSLLWTSQRDSCGFVILSRRGAGSTADSSGQYILAAEWFGTSGPGRVWDVAPSPDWRWLASGVDYQLDTAGDHGTWRELATAWNTSEPELARLGVPIDSRRVRLALPVVDPLFDTCSGDGCPTNGASPSVGGWKVAWSDDGTAALFGSRSVPTQWVAVDPTTRVMKPGPAPALRRPMWAAFSVQDLATRRGATASGGGSYTFVARNDTIVVRGPNHDGVAAERVVGPGNPVVATRNGQYLLAVRRDSAAIRSILYEFRLSQSLMTASCDRARK